MSSSAPESPWSQSSAMSTGGSNSSDVIDAYIKGICCKKVTTRGDTLVCSAASAECCFEKAKIASMHDDASITCPSSMATFADNTSTAAFSVTADPRNASVVTSMPGGTLNIATTVHDGTKTTGASLLDSTKTMDMPLLCTATTTEAWLRGTRTTDTSLFGTKTVATSLSSLMTTSQSSPTTTTTPLYNRTVAVPIQSNTSNDAVTSAMMNSSAGFCAGLRDSSSSTSSATTQEDSLLCQTCVVCGDKSSGKHYGQMTCEGCKSFFKRSVRRDTKYACRNDQSCPVDVDRRNQCQHCRLKKCLAVGMRKEAVQRSRMSSVSSSSTYSPYPMNPFVIIPNTISANHIDRQSAMEKCEPVSSFIAILINADPYRQSLGSILSEIAYRQGGLLESDRVGELSSRLLFSVIGFAKNLPMFNEFDISDQISLICSSWSELFLLNMAQCDVHLDTASLLTFSGLYSMFMAGERVSLFLDQIGMFQDRIRKLQALELDVVEYSCLKSLVLFSPDAIGLCDTEKAAAIQGKSQQALENYCDNSSRRSSADFFEESTALKNLKHGHGRFGRLLLRLPGLRSVGQMVEQLFFARIVCGTPIEAIIRDQLISTIK